MLWFCIPQGFAVEVPVAPRVRVFHRLNGLPVNSQWFQDLQLQQHLWGRRTGLLRQHQAPVMLRKPTACEVPGVCRALFSPPLAHQPHLYWSLPCREGSSVRSSPALCPSCLPASQSRPRVLPPTSTSRFRGLKPILTSNNINRLVGWATVQDALSPLVLFFFQGWCLLLLDALLIQLMEPVDNVSSNNSFPCA